MPDAGHRKGCNWGDFELYRSAMRLATPLLACTNGYQYAELAVELRIHLGLCSPFDHAVAHYLGFSFRTSLGNHSITDAGQEVLVGDTRLSNGGMNSSPTQRLAIRHRVQSLPEIVSRLRNVDSFAAATPIAARASAELHADDAAAEDDEVQLDELEPIHDEDADLNSWHQLRVEAEDHGSVRTPQQEAVRERAAAKALEETKDQSRKGAWWVAMLGERARARST